MFASAIGQAACTGAILACRHRPQEMTALVITSSERRLVTGPIRTAARHRAVTAIPAVSQKSASEAGAFVFKGTVTMIIEAACPFALIAACGNAPELTSSTDAVRM